MSKRHIDVDALLRPLSDGADGVGSDLRLDVGVDSLYRQLKDARLSARDEERDRDRNADEATDSAAPIADGWRTVLPLGEQILADRSKDLEVAAWMTEALVRLHGLVGLEAGAELIAGLCERFWDHCHPVIDQEGLESRAIPLRGLAGDKYKGTLLQPLRQLALFRRGDGSALNHFLWQKMTAAEALKEEERTALFAAGLPKREVLLAEAEAEHKAVMQRWRQVLAARKAWVAMEAVLDAKFGAESPSTREMLALLDGIADALVQLGAREEEPVAAGEPAGGDDTGDPETVGDDAGAPEAVRRGAPAGVRTRESALRELEAVAEFFRRTEPHSPLAYTLDEAVRRGRMSLTELLAEVLPDEDVRTAMLGRLGIRVSSDN